MYIKAKELSELIKDGVKEKIKKENIRPTFLIIQVGKNDASNLYVKNKLKACEYCDIETTHALFPEEVTTEKLVNFIKETQHNYHAVMVQLPLPAHIDKEEVINAIEPDKDVDGLTETNIDRLWNGKDGLFPCTALGVVEYLKYIIYTTSHDVSTYPYEEVSDSILSGKKVCVIGRSNLVGKPVSALLQRADCTVDVCHSKTENIMDHIRRAEAVVIAIGKPEYFVTDDFRDGQYIIDVGINRDKNNKLCGDVAKSVANELPNCKISPVPGGVGLLTVAMLMKNVLKAYYLNKRD